MTIAGIVAALGTLFGLNFIGLFVAAYVFGGRAVHVLFYLAATAAFLVTGLCYLLSMLTPHPAFWVACVEISVALGMLFFGHGFSHAFGLPLSRRFVWGMFAAGTATTMAVSGLAEMDVLRLSVVSLWHAVISFYLAWLFFRAPDAGLKHRTIGVLLVALALATVNRPLTSAIIQLETAWSQAEQAATYGATVSIIYLTVLFGLAASIFFHVMSDLVADYRRASIHDSLTGLLNRRGFLDAAAAVPARPMTLIMLDIDRFKAVNDTFGHAKGDEVIKAAADIMKRAAPTPHICGRLGGEEFAILLQRAEPVTAEALAQSMRAAMEIELAQSLPGGRPVTASFGVAQLGEGGLEQALIDADQALYDAKRRGRNRVCVAGDGDAAPKTGRPPRSRSYARRLRRVLAAVA